MAKKKQYKDLSDSRKNNVLVQLAAITEGLNAVKSLFHYELMNLKFLNSIMNNKLSKAIELTKSLLIDVSVNLRSKDFEQTEHERPTHISRILLILPFLSVDELERLADEIEKPFNK